MKTIFKTILFAAAVAVSAASCTKSAGLLQPTGKEGETVEIRINGMMGDYAPQNDTKSGLVSNVRVLWEGNETIYVFDGTQCLGSLKSAVTDPEGRFALLSTDGDAHTVKKPVDGTEKLTLIYSPLLEEVPAVEDGEITISLAEQNGPIVPFVIFATIDYKGDESIEIKDVAIPFKFATSVLTMSCAGLDAREYVDKLSLTNVNTVCKLRLSGTGSPEISGEQNGVIKRNNDKEHRAQDMAADSYGTASLQLALPALALSPGKRTLSVTQSDNNVFSDKKFSVASLEYGKSANTVCDMKPVPLFLSRPFKVNKYGEVRYFTRGNLYWNGEDFLIESDQWEGATSWDKNHVSHFAWVADKEGAYLRNPIKDPYYGTPLFTERETFTIYERAGKWHTLSVNEWECIFKYCQHVSTTIFGVQGILIFYEGYLGDTKGPFTEIPEDCIFLPFIGRKIDGDIIKEYKGDVPQNYYWTRDTAPTSVLADKCNAYLVESFGSDKAEFPFDYCCPIRLCRESEK